MTQEPPPLPPFPDEFEEFKATAPQRVQTEGQPLPILLHGIFGHLHFRPHQEEVCQAVMA